MNELLNFLKDIFMIKKEDNIRVGLTQFRTQEPVAPIRKDVSIRNKDVKLSDLMRRVG